MKYRMYRAQMNKALLWYTEKLTERHLGKILTPARMEQIRYDLQILQNEICKRETNSVWKVPVTIEFFPEKSFFQVVVADDSNILYLDPD